MNWKYLVSVVVLFVASLLMDFVIHAVVLQPDYAAMPALMRNEADARRHFPALLLAHAFFAVGVTSIYRRGRERGKGWLGQGFRFGLWLTAVACVPGFLIYYAVQPIGHMLVLKQVVFGGTATVLLGLVAARLNPLAAPANPGTARR